MLFMKEHLQYCLFITQMFLMILCVSCDRENSLYQPTQRVTFFEGECFDTLLGYKIDYDSINVQTGIECIDSFVIVLGERNGALFSVINANNDSLVSQFGIYGHSKSEFLSSTDMCQFVRTKNDGILMCVQNYESDVIGVYDLKASIRNRKTVYEKSLSYNIDKSKVWNYRCFLLDDNNYLLYKGLSSEGDARDRYSVPPCFMVHSKYGEFTISAYPSAIHTGDNDFVNRMYTELPRVNTDMTKVVEMLAYVDLFTIVDLDTYNTIGVMGEKSHGLEYYQQLAKDKKGEDLYKSVLIHNVAFNVSDNYIIVCRDGRTPVSRFEELFMYKPHVLFFDWGGNLLFSFCVNETVMRVAYNEKNKKLYGLTNNGDLYGYDLLKYIP